MTWINRIAWAESFEQFFADFADCFKRKEARSAAGAYSRGLLAEIERKNCWQIAERLGYEDPQQLQRLINENKWDEDEVCRLSRKQTDSRLGFRPGIGVLDESGFVKGGAKSAGVGRQYCGRLGTVETCQVGVCRGDVAPLGYA